MALVRYDSNKLFSSVYLHLQERNGIRYESVLKPKLGCMSIGQPFDPGQVEGRWIGLAEVEHALSDRRIYDQRVLRPRARASKDGHDAGEEGPGAQGGLPEGVGGDMAAIRGKGHRGGCLCEALKGVGSGTGFKVKDDQRGLLCARRCRGHIGRGYEELLALLVPRNAAKGLGEVAEEGAKVCVDGCADGRLARVHHAHALVDEEEQVVLEGPGRLVQEAGEEAEGAEPIGDGAAGGQFGEEKGEDGEALFPQELQQGALGGAQGGVLFPASGTSGSAGLGEPGEEGPEDGEEGGQEGPPHGQALAHQLDGRRAEERPSPDEAEEGLCDCCPHRLLE